MAKSKKPVAKKKPAVKKTPVKKAAQKKAAAKKIAPKKTKIKKPVTKKTVSKKAVKAVVKKAKIKKPAPQKAVVTRTKAPTMKKMDLTNVVTPLDDRVMVQLAAPEKMTAGGLYIPDTVVGTSGNLQGIVVSVGRGHRNKKGYVRPMDLQVGDKVLFSEYSGSKIKIQDQDLLIIREGDVLGVIA